MFQKITLLLLGIWWVGKSLNAQTVKITVKDQLTNEPIGGAVLSKGNLQWLADKEGVAELSFVDSLSLDTLLVSASGYLSQPVIGKPASIIALMPNHKALQGIVVSGFLRPQQKLASPIPVEEYQAAYFKKTVVANLQEAMSMINGVQTQMACIVCNTAGFQVNGLEAPYTSVLIDGMPMVSALASVYGFASLPTSLIQRVEVVKGPAGTLYGSEAMAGLINIITKPANGKQQWELEGFGSSYGEWNGALTYSSKVKNWNQITSVFSNGLTQSWDRNNDGFNDISLFNRYGVFNKWNGKLGSGKFQSMIRYYGELRVGGQIDFTPIMKGSDSIYGEWINTNRMEAMLNWEVANGILEASWNGHFQDSWYGLIRYTGKQQVAFAQWRKFKTIGHHQLQFGFPFRYTYYDDNSVITANDQTGANQPSNQWQGGAFIQDEWRINSKWMLLGGLRAEYHNQQQWIASPRLAIRYLLNEDASFRVSSGNGFRVVNLFAEEHAALTGARNVILAEDLQPERSWNITLNHNRYFHFNKGYLAVDASLFYTYFNNRIIPDFETDPNAIIYANLKGYSVSKGVSLSLDWNQQGLYWANAGVTYLDVYQVDDAKQRNQQLLVPTWSGVYGAGTAFLKRKVKMDISGRWQSSMIMPIQTNDPRPSKSPFVHLMDIKLTWQPNAKYELFVSARNVFDYFPKYGLMRPEDPFDKGVNDPVRNPNGHTFDTQYSYAPLMGRVWSMGGRLRW